MQQTLRPGETFTLGAGEDTFQLVLPQSEPDTRYTRCQPADLTHTPAALLQAGESAGRLQTCQPEGLCPHTARTSWRECTTATGTAKAGAPCPALLPPARRLTAGPLRASTGARTTGAGPQTGLQTAGSALLLLHGSSLTLGTATCRT